MDKGLLLHAGCGSSPLPDWLNGYREIRLDIDKAHSPDIVASITDLGDIGSFDAIWCSHAVEHLCQEDVRQALSEFYRVLNPGGYAVILVPDLEGISATRETLFVSQAGPVSGIDLMYGLGTAIKENPYMRHLTGFISSTLEECMSEVGFRRITTKRLSDYNLMGVGFK